MRSSVNLDADRDKVGQSYPDDDQAHTSMSKIAKSKRLANTAVQIYHWMCDSTGWNRKSAVYDRTIAPCRPNTKEEERSTLARATWSTLSAHVVPHTPYNILLCAPEASNLEWVLGYFTIAEFLVLLGRQ